MTGSLNWETGLNDRLIKLGEDALEAALAQPSKIELGVAPDSAELSRKLGERSREALNAVVWKSLLCLLLCCSSAYAGIGLGIGLPITRGGPSSAATAQPLYYQSPASATPLAQFIVPGSTDPTSATIDGRGFNPFRCPILVRCNNSDVLAFYEAHEGANDYQASSIFMVRKSGANWGSPVLVYRRSDYSSGSAWLNLGAVVVHRSTGRVHLMFCKADGSQPGQVYTPWTMYSDDHGSTWSSPAEISATTLKSDDTHFVGNGGGAAVSGTIPAYCKTGSADASNSRWRYMAFGPARGVCTANGANAGRLTVPAQHRYTIGVNVSGAADNGSGKVRITTAGTHYLATGDVAVIASVGGTTEANGIQTVTRIDSTHFDIPAVAFANVYTSGGVVGGQAYSHSIYSDDNGVTWALGGGFTEKTANRDTNEGCIAEVGSSGSIYFNCRGVSSASGVITQTTRGQATITDATSAWSDVAVMVDGSAANVNVSESAGSITAASSDLFFVCPGDPSTTPNRARMTVWKSANSGASWTLQRPIYFGYSGYSATLALDGSSLLSVFEKTVDKTSAAGDAVTSNQCLGVATYNRTWLAGAATYPDQFTWWFNEDSNGTAISTAGKQLLDHGANGSRVMCQHGNGGAIATFDTVGLNFLGSGGSPAGVILQEAQTGTNATGGALDPGLGSMTWETEFLTPTSTASRTIMGNSGGGNSGFDCSFVTIANPHKLRVIIGDGTTSLSKTQASGTYDDSTYYRLQIVYERGVSLRIYINETLTDTAADTLDATKYIKGSNAFALGKSASASSGYLLNGSKMKYLRITRGALSPSQFLGTSPTKQTPQSLHGYDYATVPASIPGSSAGAHPASCKLVLNATYYGGRSGDMYGGWDYPAMASTGPTNGTGFQGYRNNVLNTELWKTGSLTRVLWWDSDNYFGKHVRHSIVSGASGFQTIATSSRYDFVQNTNAWTLVMGAEFISDTGTTQYLFDNITGTTTGAGWAIVRNTATNRLTLLISKAGSATLNETPTNPALATGTRYYVGISGRGDGQHVDIYYGAYSAGLVAPTLLKVTTTGTVDCTGQPFASAGAYYVGARNDATRDCDWRTKNIHLYSEASTSPTTDAATIVGSDAFHQAWANAMVAY
jgi:hypothetical protein